MNSDGHRKFASELTRLLRAELRDCRFVVSSLATTDTEFVPGEYGGSTSSNVEETAREELDAQGLKALHQAGNWRHDPTRHDIRTQALFSIAEGAARLAAFERLLDCIGVLSEGCVAHALDAVISTRYGSTVGSSDAPDKSIGVSTTADVWSYLLVDACLTTPRRTAGKLLRWVRGAPFAFETRVLLGRLNAASSFALANGLSVERLPRRIDSLEGWFAASSDSALSDYLDRTMLRIPCRLSPFLTKPARITERLDGSRVQSWKFSADITATWPLPPGGVHELARALSLVCDVAVELPRIWSDYSEHAHFGQRSSRSWMSYGASDLPPRASADPELTADGLKRALRLQPKLRNMPDSLNTALRYWLKSKSRRSDPADRLVFLRTALEILFLPKESHGEFTYRLATNGAWYTGRDRAERQEIFDDLKKAYNAASAAVHTGSASDAQAPLLEQGQAICRRAILKRIRTGQAPVWEDIVFGR